MAEYIDRKALGIGKCNPDVFENKGYAEGWNSAIEIIENAPAADVVEVKHGYWKVLVFKGGRGRARAEAKCSICGRDAVYQIIEDKWEFENYCPHCGAKMDGEHNER